MTGDRLIDRYDAVLFDLDGTVYLGTAPIPGAADTVNTVREQVTVGFITNAARSPKLVAERLTKRGFNATPGEVSTSAQAAIALLAERFSTGDHVLVLGNDELADEISAAGFSAVRFAAKDTVAVVQGFSRDLGWRELAEACLAIRAGALWIACNADHTYPSERGLLPGTGAMVAALQAATEQEPVVAGKPERPLLDQAIRLANARCPLMVGDRIGSDVAAANTVGVDAFLVLTGASDPAELLAAPKQLRPLYVAQDLTAVLCAYEDVAIAEQQDWKVELINNELVAAHCTDATADPMSLLRALCAAWWQVGTGQVNVHANDDATGKTLVTLGLR